MTTPTESIRHNTCLALLMLSILSTVSGCAAPESTSRTLEARPNETIFSPLDWPTPNATRTASGRPGHAYWQQQVDYSIDASLDPTSHRISGRATVTYHNNSPDDLAYLWLTLEQNLFREESQGILAGGGTANGSSPAVFGGYEIISITANGDDLPFHEYETVGRVDLPEPIERQGGTFTFEIAWSYKMGPEQGMRMGLTNEADAGPIYEIAQWFPAVCVYDDTHGWNTLPYLGSGEYYTNFGDYDVRITVPRDYLCVATGELQNASVVLTKTQLERLEQARSGTETVMIRTAEEVNDPDSRPSGNGPLTWHYQAQNVRTFAWAASPAFIWDAASVDVPDDDIGTRQVLCMSVYPQEVQHIWRESTSFVQHAISFYSDFMVPYPYPVMTNVFGREGGMEYPMLIFCRGTRGRESLFGVTDHEVGHTWFPMLVNNNERRYAWMDEGFNTFVNHYSDQAFLDDPGGGNMQWVARRMQRSDALPIMTPPDRLSSLGFLAYRKPGAGLRILRDYILGPERFDPAFKAYMRAWSFKSPRPSDFFRMIENGAGADLAWFWRGWFYETSLIDQGIENVTRTKAGDNDDQWLTTVTLRNFEEQVMPVEMLITYEDGTTERKRLPVEIWFTNDRSTYAWTSSQKVDAVELDPDQQLPDIDRTNNTWER